MKIDDDCTTLTIDTDSSIDSLMTTSSVVRKSSCLSTRPSMVSLSDASMSDSESRESNRSVKFQSVEIREYNMILGDNPCPLYGPPVTIDWDYDSAPSLSLDQYEDNQPQQRNGQQVFMNSRIRNDILYNSAGHTDDKIQQAKK